ncbi:hypothetical protein IDVR_08140 [Intrasporangium sp. DVR]
MVALASVVTAPLNHDAVHRFQPPERSRVARLSGSLTPSPRSAPREVRRLWERAQRHTAALCRWDPEAGVAHSDSASAEVANPLPPLALPPTLPPVRPYTHTAAALPAFENRCAIDAM